MEILLRGRLDARQKLEEFASLPNGTLAVIEAFPVYGFRAAGEALINLPLGERIEVFGSLERHEITGWRVIAEKVCPAVSKPSRPWWRRMFNNRGFSQ